MAEAINGRVYVCDVCNKNRKEKKIARRSSLVAALVFVLGEKKKLGQLITTLKNDIPLMSGVLISIVNIQYCVRGECDFPFVALYSEIGILIENIFDKNWCPLEISKYYTHFEMKDDLRALCRQFIRLTSKRPITLASIVTV